MGSEHSLALLVLLGVPVAAGQGTELAACAGLSLLALPDRAALSPQGGTGGGSDVPGAPLCQHPLCEGALGPC